MTETTKIDPAKKCSKPSAPLRRDVDKPREDVDKLMEGKTT